MAGRQEFPKNIGDRIYKEDISPIVADTTTIIRASHYGLPDNRIGTVIQASDINVSQAYTYTSGSGSLTVPQFARKMSILIIGGGGGAGGGSEQDPYVTGGGGGGAGGLLELVISVSPGDNIVWTVGAGGSGYKTPGNISGKPDDGGDSQVVINGSTTYQAPGGKSASSGATKHYNIGGIAGNTNSSNGTNGTFSGVGGIGGSVPGYGTGGSNGTSKSDMQGKDGVGYGAGGGGGFGYGASGAPKLGRGGNGTAGVVRIQFTTS